MSSKTFSALFILSVAAAGLSASSAESGADANRPAPPVAAAKSGGLVVSTSNSKPKVDFARFPLSFEPNMGQTDRESRFIGKSHGYVIKLDPRGATFQFQNSSQASDTVRMTLDNSNSTAELAGQGELPGKSGYFPTGDPKTWITNVPNYQRVHYSGVYSGVDVSFYGSANRLEYDFLVNPGSDPSQIRMKIAGSQYPVINKRGDLVLPFGQRDLHFLKPVAYQLSRDGKIHDLVSASYQLAKNAAGDPVVTFALGKYDHTRQLVIDPVVDALSYSQYINQYYVGALTVDSAGNAYITGQAYPTNYAFYVNKYGPTGTQLYTASFGTGNNAYPYAIAVDGSGQTYVTGQVATSNSTVPTTTGAYQPAPAANVNQEVFVAVLSASGAAPVYCTYLSGTDSQESNSVALAIDSSSNVYIGGHTYQSTFPTTTGAYQTANPSNVQIGFVAKFNPTKSGAASLVYSTLLGSSTTSGPGQQVNRLAVDYAGNAYIAAQGGPGYPVTTGAFRYNGIQSANGGAYVTKLNATGTALVYSAYLGYAGASGIAIDTVTSGTPSAYVSGWIYGNGEDFPTTPGAYQSSYASGFAVKLNGTGSAETYSTFLSGPSGYNTNAVDPYPTIAVPVGCASNCNAYIAGRTNTSDWPLVNPVQANPATAPTPRLLLNSIQPAPVRCFPATSAAITTRSTEQATARASVSLPLSPLMAQAISISPPTLRAGAPIVTCRKPLLTHRAVTKAFSQGSMPPPPRGIC